MSFCKIIGNNIECNKSMRLNIHSLVIKSLTLHRLYNIIIFFCNSLVITIWI